MSKRIVIALGGNALGNTAAQQLELVSLTAKPIVDLIAAGNEVIIAHGNGPQVGMINLGLSTAAEAGAIKSDMPFPECGAMSQGYIGYHLQNAIGNELTARGLRKDVATVVTQVLVDENDPAFQHPTKPIGSFYDKVAADRIMAQRGCTMVEDAGRGWRQVVPSPKPVDVIEKNTVRALVDSVTVVITALTAIAVFQQITGIMFPVFDVMSTVDPDLGMTPLNNGLLVCGQIGIVLIGAFPMVEWITRTFGGALSKLGGALGMNDKGSAGLVATLANNIAMFNIMGEMNPKGKILNVAFAVSAAFVFGDHLGFAAGNDAQMIFPMIAGKLVAGVTALIVANLLAPKLLSKIQTISK